MLPIQYDLIHYTQPHEASLGYMLTPQLMRLAFQKLAVLYVPPGLTFKN